VFKISYGLYVLTARENNKDNGCIINTAQLVTDNPMQISITVNKTNLTHEMIMNTKVFNLNVLTTATPMKIFQTFGFSSGRDVNKFEDYGNDNYSKNGVRILEKYINAYISGKVTKTVDVGTHTIFIADIVDAVEISKDESVTYDYYYKNIKPTNRSNKEYLPHKLQTLIHL
jgi:flavin reductase (DIM6/NTAB) family NADH-FMN oxidoreductase RutF